VGIVRKLTIRDLLATLIVAAAVVNTTYFRCLRFSGVLRF
jgi:hypothetical protein